jgi:hypothetical protein
MTTSAITGDLQLLPDGTLEGWVWSRDRPDQALIAEVVVDDVRVGEVVASLYRRDLAGQGVGDGHHGFRLRLPPGTIPADAPVVISGREHASKQVFARLVRDGLALTPKQREAIESASVRVRELWAGLEPLLANRSATSKASRVRATLQQLSALLATRARTRGAAVPCVAGVTLERLWHAAGRLDLPLLARPSLSVIMPAGLDVHATLRRVRALAPALRPAQAEIVLVDDGADPATALVPALAPNLVYVRAAGPDEVARSFAEAARIARGACIAMLEPEPAEPSATALLAVARHTAGSPRTVLLGGAALAACARLDALDSMPPDSPAPARLGLRIALARDLLVRAGGLEPTMMDGAALESADLWLRCRLLGADALAWREPARSPGEQAPHRTHPQAALRALAAFRRRWKARALPSTRRAPAAL